MHRLLLVPLLATVLLAAPASAEKRGSGWSAPAPAATLPDDTKAAIAANDALYEQRQTGDNQQKAYDQLVELAKKHPDSPDVNWRLARAAFWIAEATKDSGKRKAIATTGWEAGKKAQSLPEGQYFMALCVGEYSHSVGILTALTEGLEGKFRDPLLAVEKKNPGIDHGGLYNALGRYKYELPWPKRDLDESVDYLRKSIQVNPQNLRGRVFLAESLWDRDSGSDRDEAKKLLTEVLSSPVGRYDTAEELRAQDLARAAQKRLGLK